MDSEVKMNWEAMAQLLPPLSADLLTKVKAEGGQTPKAAWRKAWTSLVSALEKKTLSSVTVFQLKYCRNGKDG